MECCLFRKRRQEGGAIASSRGKEEKKNQDSGRAINQSIICPSLGSRKEKPPVGWLDAEWSEGGTEGGEAGKSISCRAVGLLGALFPLSHRDEERWGRECGAAGRSRTTPRAVLPRGESSHHVLLFLFLVLPIIVISIRCSGVVVIRFFLPYLPCNSPISHRSTATPSRNQVATDRAMDRESVFALLFGELA